MRSLSPLSDIEFEERRVCWRTSVIGRLTEKGTETLVDEGSINNGVLKNASSRTTIAPSIREIDGLVVLGMSQDDLDFYEGFSPQKRSRLNYKVCCGAVPGCQLMSITRPEELQFPD